MTKTSGPAVRRFRSRNVVLTATFLALAAGGTAACDSSTPADDVEGWDSSYVYGSGPAPDVEDEAPEAVEDEPADDEAADEAADEVFYCADEDGEVVDEDQCDPQDTAFYFLWHSSGYPRGLKPGTQLDGGDYFAPGDLESRQAYRLPTAGRVGNGTVKTNVVGRSSGGPAAGSSGLRSSGG
ncbi:hypothetical protein [Actinoplanes sp. NPDC051494]|uniref:hypothetical protein n=1 Tax=Actinoplanes sp. NPDC051494 TaxID=3363907 RepID=UPI003795D57F